MCSYACVRVSGMEDADGTMSVCVWAMGEDQEGLWEWVWSGWVDGKRVRGGGGR